MKLKFNGILVLLVLVAQLTFAQEEPLLVLFLTKQGPLPGVSVLVKEQNQEHKLILMVNLLLSNA
jgi:hypothetical protein